MHRWSQLFIPTLREAPADAEVASHKLLLRAGYIRQLGAGIYSFLPLGQRSLNKIIAIVRDEMDKIGQEFFLPALNPVELWQESGREAVMGQNLFHLKDRKGAELVLAMTHEEVITSIARNELRSYKQLPQIWYQIQTKFRDEPRPKSGLLRVRQFLMKDSYSFDLDDAGLDESYNKHDRAYRAIFTRSGLDFVAVEADSGAMGGSGSQEFMVYTEAGEDLIASCRSCGYAANLEKATSKLALVEDLVATSDKPEDVHTPGQKTIDEVGAFLQVKSIYQMKAQAVMVKMAAGSSIDWLPVLVFLRGDHTLNETKLLGLVGGKEMAPMTADQLSLFLGTVAGYIGPCGANAIDPANWKLDKGVLILNASDKTQARIALILDSALEGRTNLIAGANKEEYHYRNVTPGRDFTPTLVADVRNVNAGEDCPGIQLPVPGVDPRVVRFPYRSDGTCTGTLEVGKAVEIGHIFKLGCKYTESMHSRVLDKDGKEVMPIMGCYGIGIERILTAAVESSAAKFKALYPDVEKTGDQYVLSPAIAPYEVVVTITNVKEAELLSAGEKLAAELTAAGLDVLLDDRDERAGVKFKDAELIGIPYRINIGKKLSEGKVELVNRLTGTTTDLALNEITTYLKSLVASSKS